MWSFHYKNLIVPPLYLPVFNIILKDFFKNAKGRIFIAEDAKLALTSSFLDKNIFAVEIILVDFSPELPSHFMYSFQYRKGKLETKFISVICTVLWTEILYFIYDLLSELHKPPVFS